MLIDKNFNLENKAVWISDEGIKFSLRGITKHHIDNYQNETWKSDLATMVGEHHGVEEKEALEIPWDGGSCVTELKEQIKDTEERDKLYKWHEDIEVESIDLSKWIIENFDRNDLIVLKMDVEGAEYKILPKRFEDGSVNYINYAFIEWHDWVMPEFGNSTAELATRLQQANVQLGGWG